MTEKTCKTVRLSFGTVLAVMTVITGALFIWQVLDLYVSGVKAGNTVIFTRPEVFSRVSKISPAFWIWVLMIIAGFVIWEVFPVKQRKGGYKDPRYALYRLKKRIPDSVGEELKDSFELVKREEKILKILWLCCAALGLAGIVYSIIYLATPSHFPNTDVTHEVLKMALNVFTWAAAVFVAACGICIYEGVSAKKQLPAAKKLAAGNKPKQVVHGKVWNIIHHKYFLLGTRIAVGCIAVAFIIAGIFNENMSRILEKAINICMECIGLG